MAGRSRCSLSQRQGLLFGEMGLKKTAHFLHGCIHLLWLVVVIKMIPVAPNKLFFTLQGIVKFFLRSPVRHSRPNAPSYME